MLKPLRTKVRQQHKHKDLGKRHNIQKDLCGQAQRPRPGGGQGCTGRRAGRRQKQHQAKAAHWVQPALQQKYIASGWFIHRHPQRKLGRQHGKSLGKQTAHHPKHQNGPADALPRGAKTQCQLTVGSGKLPKRNVQKNAIQKAERNCKLP